MSIEIVKETKLLGTIISDYLKQPIFSEESMGNNATRKEHIII